MSELEDPRTTTVGRWFGPPQRPLLGWLSTRDGRVGESAVLIAPPVGYAYWSSHRTLRVIAERLAAAGHSVLRFDYDGTGDSAGEQSDGERVRSWRASVTAAAQELRALGARRLTIVGIRLGGMLALLDGAALDADAIVLWAPVVSGRRYAKEIRLLATDTPESAADWPPGTVVAAGCIYLPQTLADIAALEIDAIVAAPAPRVLIVGEPEARLGEHLRTLGCEVGQCVVDGGAQALESPTEYATVPEGIVAAIASWLGPGDPVTPASVGAAPAAYASAQLEWGGVELREEVVTLGSDRFVGVFSEPLTGQARATTLVFLNTGSEPHIGPGRAWVEYARSLAGEGYRCLRVDFRGWGESPDDGHAPGRPYDAHAVDDAVAVVAALRAHGGGPIVLLGLCASAWVALRAVLREPVEGVVALNPQLYWEPGDPVEATMTETRLRRTAEREREARGGRCGVWTVLDLLGHRPWAGRWLDQLAATGVPITMAFAVGDDGVEYLRNRLARRFEQVQRGAAIRVVEIPDIDHSMGRAWLRGRVVAMIREQLAAFAAAAA